MLETQYDCHNPVANMEEWEIIKMIINDKLMDELKEKKKNEVSRNYDIVVGV